MQIGENVLLQSAMAIIRYGSEIILRHEPTRGFLRSPGVPYRHPKSSQQDQVTCLSTIDSKSSWFVKPPYGYPDDYLYGQPIQDGAVLRLENRASRKHLHSHGNAPSPVSNQQEVTCFINRDGSGDLNDNWILQIDRKKIFETNTPFRLIHTLTGCALHSHANALCVAIVATLYLWNMVASFSTSHIQPLLQNTFGVK